MSLNTELDQILTMAWTPVEFRKSITYVSAGNTQRKAVTEVDRDMSM